MKKQRMLTCDTRLTGYQAERVGDLIHVYLTGGGVDLDVVLSVERAQSLAARLLSCCTPGED